MNAGDPGPLSGARRDDDRDARRELRHHRGLDLVFALAAPARAGPARAPVDELARDPDRLPPAIAATSSAESGTFWRCAIRAETFARTCSRSPRRTLARSASSWVHRTRLIPAERARANSRDIQQLGDPYRPYRSVAAWYCWRAELYAGAAESVLTGPSARTSSMARPRVSRRRPGCPRPGRAGRCRHRRRARLQPARTISSVPISVVPRTISSVTRLAAPSRSPPASARAPGPRPAPSPAGCRPGCRSCPGRPHPAEAEGQFLLARGDVRRDRSSSSRNATSAPWHTSRSPRARPRAATHVQVLEVGRRAFGDEARPEPAVGHGTGGSSISATSTRRRWGCRGSPPATPHRPRLSGGGIWDWLPEKVIFSPAKACGRPRWSPASGPAAGRKAPRAGPRSPAGRIVRGRAGTGRPTAGPGSSRSSRPAGVRSRLDHPEPSSSRSVRAARYPSGDGASAPRPRRPSRCPGRASRPPGRSRGSRPVPCAASTVVAVRIRPVARVLMAARFGSSTPRTPASGRRRSSAPCPASARWRG